VKGKGLAGNTSHTRRSRGANPKTGGTSFPYHPTVRNTKRQQVLEPGPPFFQGGEKGRSREVHRKETRLRGGETESELIGDKRKELRKKGGSLKELRSGSNVKKGEKQSPSAAPPIYS